MLRGRGGQLGAAGAAAEADLLGARGGLPRMMAACGRSRLLGTGGFALGAGTCFGILPVVMVRAYSAGATAMAYVLVRATVAGVILLASHAILAWRRRRRGGGMNGKPPRAAERRCSAVAAWLLLASTLYAGFSLSLFCSFVMLPVSVASLAFYTYPLLVLAAAFLPPRCCRPGAARPDHHAAPTDQPPPARPQLPSRAVVALHVVAFGGLALAIGPAMTAGRSDGSSDGASELPEAELSAQGMMLAFCASGCFAGYCVCASRVALLGTPPLLSAAAVNLLQAAVLVSACVAAVATLDPVPDLLAWGVPAAASSSSGHSGGLALFSVGVVLYVCAQAAMFVAFVLAERASEVSFFLNVEPLVSVALGVAVLGEPFRWFQWAGLVLLLAALSASSLEPDAGRCAPGLLCFCAVAARMPWPWQLRPPAPTSDSTDAAPSVAAAAVAPVRHPAI